MAAVPGRSFVFAGGKDDGRGVLPDYEVKQKPEDTAKGADTVLQFTLNLVKSGDPLLNNDKEKVGRLPKIQPTLEIITAL